jgi:hypothetical protein
VNSLLNTQEAQRLPSKNRAQRMVARTGESE